MARFKSSYKRPALLFHYVEKLPEQYFSRYNFCPARNHVFPSVVIDFPLLTHITWSVVAIIHFLFKKCLSEQKPSRRRKRNKQIPKDFVLSVDIFFYMVIPISLSFLQQPSYSYTLSLLLQPLSMLA